MKFAKFSCGGCKRAYDSYIEDGAFMPCPNCQQFNSFSSSSLTITGRCAKCDRPMEASGHVWFHDQFLECKNGGKK